MREPAGSDGTTSRRRAVAWRYALAGLTAGLIALYIALNWRAAAVPLGRLVSALVG